MGIEWPRLLTPTKLIRILRQQKNPLTALHLFITAPIRHPPYRHNAPAYSAMLSILASSGGGHVHLISPLLRHLTLSDSCRCPDSLFSSAIQAYASAGLHDEALRLYRSIPLSNCTNWTGSYNAVIRLLIEQGRLEEAVGVFVDGCGKWEVRLKIDTLNLLVSAMCEMGRLDSALEVFGEIKQQFCSPDRETYRALMKGLCDAGRLDDAVHLLYSMMRRISEKGCGDDVVVYKIVLEALCEEGRVSDAEEVLGKVLKKGIRVPRLRRAFHKWKISKEGGLTSEEMKRSVCEALVKGGVQSAVSYCAMVEELYAEGKDGNADELLDEMVQKGFKPRVETYEAKIVDLCRKGGAVDAVKVMKVEMPLTACSPSVITYNLVMRGLCGERKSLMAVELLKEMGRRGDCVPSKETYEIVAEGLCRENQFMEALKVAEKMMDKWHLPANATYNSILRGLSSLGRSYDALLLLEEMLSRGKLPGVDAWSSLVSMACRAMEPQEVNLLHLDRSAC